MTWPSNLGYLNAPASATGLTQLGARQYDPNLGRFITVDPVLDTSEPRHANAYSYSYSSPVSYSDPTGLIGTRALPDGGGGSRSTPGYSDKNTAPPPAPGSNKPVTTNVGGTTVTYGSGNGYMGGGCGSSYNPCGAPQLTAEQRAANSSIAIHGLLTTLGLVPGIGEIADGLDALVCLTESDLVCAGLSVTSMAPFLGWGSAGAKYAKLGGEMIEMAGDTAARSGDELVNLASDTRTAHILTGEVRPNGSFGGGDRPGTGYPDKSEFPAGWSDEQIMHQVSDVATDPSVTWRSGRPGDYFANGTRDGVDIEVLIRNGEIWTGYPTNVPRNPR